MIRITTFPPSALIAPYIHFLWIAETTDSLIEEPMSMPPSGCILLTMFSNESRYEIKLHGEEFKLSPRAALQGQHHGPIITRASSDHTHAVGIMFKPSGFYQLWKMNMGSLTDKISDGETILGPNLTQLLNELSRLQTSEQRIEASIRFIEKEIQQRTRAASKSEKIVELMQQHMGTMAVGDVAKEFQINTRSLERIFAEEIGISPKYMNRVMQFNNALQILKYEPGIRWAELATRAGYYDQAHMIKAFLEFSGKSPVGYDGKDTRFTETHLNKDADTQKNTYE